MSAGEGELGEVYGPHIPLGFIFDDLAQTWVPEIEPRRLSREKSSVISSGDPGVRGGAPLQPLAD